MLFAQMLLMGSVSRNRISRSRAAKDIETGIAEVLSRMETVTPDLQGTASTEEMGEAICRAILAV